MYLYAVGHHGGPQKVGYTSDPAGRLKALRQVAGDRSLPMHHAVETQSGYAIHAERMAHWLLRAHHWRLEWFSCTPEVAVDAIRTAAGLTYSAPDFMPTTCNPNRAFDELMTLRLHKGTFARIEAAVGSRDRADFVREAISNELTRREREAKRRA